MSNDRRTGISPMVICGCVLLVAGVAIGRLSRPHAAYAQQFNDMKSTDRFGIGVPSGGFALVKAPNGRAFVVDSGGRARRILFSANPNADDQPRPADTEWLVLY